MKQQVLERSASHSSWENLCDEAQLLSGLLRNCGRNTQGIRAGGLKICAWLSWGAAQWFEHQQQHFLDVTMTECSKGNCLGNVITKITNYNSSSRSEGMNMCYIVRPVLQMLPHVL